MKNKPDPSISQILTFNYESGLQVGILDGENALAVGEIENHKLAKVLLKGFNREIVYRFRKEPLRRGLQKFVNEISGNEDEFRKFSAGLADAWMSAGMQPEKTIEIIFCMFRHLPHGDGTTSGYGIFLIDGREKFLQLMPSPSGMLIKLNEGVHLKKMNDAALIVQGSDESSPAIFLRRNRDEFKTDMFTDRFLQIEPEKNSFNNTVGHMNMLRAFVDHELEDAGPFDKVDKISRSAEYFNTHDQFNRSEFGSAIFEEPEHRAAFDQFREQYAHDREIRIADEFEISPDAVKRNSRRIRSVIKLDRNFHIYIHGNRHNIVRGYDPERGKHFYQLYFDEES